MRASVTAAGKVAFVASFANFRSGRYAFVDGMPGIGAAATRKADLQSCVPRRKCVNRILTLVLDGQ